MKNESDTKEAVRQIGIQIVAAQAGIHAQTVYRWMRGELSPTLKTYGKIVAAVETLSNDK